MFVFHQKAQLNICRISTPISISGRHMAVSTAASRNMSVCYFTPEAKRSSIELRQKEYPPPKQFKTHTTRSWQTFRNSEEIIQFDLSRSVTVYASITVICFSMICTKRFRLKHLGNCQKYHATAWKFSSLYGRFDESYISNCALGNHDTSSLQCWFRPQWLPFLDQQWYTYDYRSFKLKSNWSTVSWNHQSVTIKSSVLQASGNLRGDRKCEVMKDENILDGSESSEILTSILSRVWSNCRRGLD